MRDYPLPLPRALVEGVPRARALVRGDNANPELRGEALFYPWQGGSLVLFRALGLPGDRLFPLRIHACGVCETGGDIPFYCAGEPLEESGPLIQLPPLLGAEGRAFSLAYTASFRPQEVLGRTLILHETDGVRIACGAIQSV